MDNTEKKWGGRRKKSGRKPLEPNKKKAQITLYVPYYIVLQHGGEDNLKKHIYSMLSKVIEQQAKD